MFNSDLEYLNFINYFIINTLIIIVNNVPSQLHFEESAHLHIFPDIKQTENADLTTMPLSSSSHFQIHLMVLLEFWNSAGVLLPCPTS